MTKRRIPLALLLIQSPFCGAFSGAPVKHSDKRTARTIQTGSLDSTSFVSFSVASAGNSPDPSRISRKFAGILGFATAHPDHDTVGSRSAGAQSWESAPDPDIDSSTEEDDELYGSFQLDEDKTSSPKVVDPLLEEYDRWSNAVDKAVTALEKKQASLQNELSKAAAVESTVARAQLLTSYLYMFTPGVTTATVQDWENNGQEIELTLHPAYDSASAEADALFQRVRKLKRGSEVVTGLLRDTNEAVSVLHEAQFDLQSVSRDEEEDSGSAASGGGVGAIDENVLRLVQDRLLRTSRITGFQAPPDKDNNNKVAINKNKRDNNKKPDMGSPASNIRKLTSPAGCTILVGRNRRGNEYLTFNVARDKDVWMHARGSPGAHVLILQRRGAVPATDDCWQLAANLAAFYSDARSERRASVTAAQPKHLLKPRGAPLGAVKLRQELQVWTAYPDNVPEELKQAREASGQSTAEYYRATDKAKLRKRNKQAIAKDKQAKQQKRAKAKRKKKKDSSSQSSSR